MPEALYLALFLGCMALIVLPDMIADWLARVWRGYRRYHRVKRPKGGPWFWE
jgi:hypothetical protein